jgi:hypothetical protein
VTLVNILVEVFHSRDGAADLNIDVALVSHGQVGVVRDDPTIVKDKVQAARGRGQQQEVVSHLVLSCFGFRHKHSWSGAHDSNSLTKFPTTTLT